MVTHITYKNLNNEWVEPKDVEKYSGGLKDKDGLDVVSGKIEKMSKSKKNVVDPNDIIDSYGADTARWFMLSDSPPERDLQWTDNGIQSSHRFINKIWDYVKNYDDYKMTEDKSKGCVEKMKRIIKFYLKIKIINPMYLKKKLRNLSVI